MKNQSQICDSTKNVQKPEIQARNFESKLKKKNEFGYPHRTVVLLHRRSGMRRIENVELQRRNTNARIPNKPSSKRDGRCEKRNPRDDETTSRDAGQNGGL